MEYHPIQAREHRRASATKCDRDPAGVQTGGCGAVSCLGSQSVSEKLSVSHAWCSGAVVRFHPGFTLYLLNPEPNHGSGPTTWPNVGPDRGSGSVGVRTVESGKFNT